MMMMKKKEEEDTTTSTINTTKPKRDSSDVGGANGVVMGNNNNNSNNKGHYKFWVLAAIVLLAVWSMFTGSVTLKWSAGNLTRFSHDLDSRTLEDLDVLEVEEREKVVRRMWDVYTHSTTTRLPRFWSDAFHAAYEQLVSDVPGVRDAAVSEIAKMSLHSLSLQQQQELPLQLQSELNIKGSRKMKQAGSSLDTTTTGSNQ